MSIHVSLQEINGHQIEMMSVLDGEENPLFLYHHGLYGTMDGEHAKNVADVAVQTGCSFISFNNHGHGPVPTVPLRQADMEGWVRTTQSIIEQQRADRQIIGVGNSLGAGVILRAFIEAERDITAFMGIGALPDVLQREVETGLNQLLNQDPRFAEAKKLFDAGETIPVPFPGIDIPVPMSAKFFEKAREFSVLDRDYHFDCPAILYHGDTDPYATPQRIEEIRSLFGDGAEVKVVNDDHDLRNQRDAIANDLWGLVSKARFTP